MSDETPKYDIRSRGYKTKGYSYKERYLKDKMCPECGGTSVYKDEWNTTISFKCMKRTCRYNWFESKPPKEKVAETTEETQSEN